MSTSTRTQSAEAQVFDKRSRRQRRQWHDDIVDEDDHDDERAVIPQASEGKRRQLVAAKIVQKETECNAKLPKSYGTSR